MKKNISPSNKLKNLNLIINSDTYKLAHEDIGLLSRNEMRGVRMLLEITKPDLILEENKILSTIIFFGGASITEESNIKKRLENIEELIKKILNAFITPGLCFKFNYFALRKIHFVMRSVAAVFFPGGFGTLDELFELLTLCQTGMKTKIPIILFGREYWKKIIYFE